MYESKLFSQGFSYYAIDLLISAKGLVCWTNIKCLRVLTSWNPPYLYTLKWHVDGLGFSNIIHAVETIKQN
jgi:hypothetical protein